MDRTGCITIGSAGIKHCLNLREQGQIVCLGNAGIGYYITGSCLYYCTANIQYKM